MIEMNTPIAKVTVNTNVILIEDAGVNMEIERGCITNYSETADGISIQLATGSQILHSNYNMPSETKRTIIHAIRSFGNVKKTKINLRDYKNPVSIEAK